VCDVVVVSLSLSQTRFANAEVVCLVRGDASADDDKYDDDDDEDDVDDGGDVSAVDSDASARARVEKALAYYDLSVDMKRVRVIAGRSVHVRMHLAYVIRV
jgi:hypothetical protein